MTLESTLEFFGKGRDQAVRLPGEARFPEGVTKVRVRGRDRILSPAGHAWDSFCLDAERPGEDFMPERAAQDQGLRLVNRLEMD